MPPTRPANQPSASNVAASGGLLGREAELGVITDRLARARTGDGGAALFAGEPGIGKSALLRAARDAANGFQVLSCRGVESEVELPFSGLHELLSPLIAGADMLPAPQRDALLAALGVQEERGGVGLLSVYAGVLGLLAHAAESTPTLLLVDDLHWVDAGTFDALSFIARRLGGLPVALLMATRPQDRWLSLDEPLVELGPLAPEDVARLANRGRKRRLTPPLAGSLAAATGGNPLAVIETVQRLGDQLDLRGSLLDDPPPVGDLIDRGFAHRLSNLSPDALGALDVAALSLLDGTGVLAAACEELNVEPAGIGEAEAAGTLFVGDGRFRFCHPLLRALVFRRMPPDRRRDCHRALAAATTGDAALRAWHAASAQFAPDEAVAGALAETAADFERRGGIVAAAKALERAAHLTPDRDLRARRLLGAARAARMGARSDWADQLLRESRDGGGDEQTRIRVEFEQIMLDAHVNGATDTPGRFLDLATRASDVDQDLSVDALCALAGDALCAGNMSIGRQSVERLREVHDFSGLLPENVIAIDEAIGVVLVLGGDPAEGEEGDRRLVAGGEAAVESSGLNFGALAEGLVWIEEYELAGRLIGRLVRESRLRGEIQSLIMALWVDGYYRLRIGDWSGAGRSLEESVRLARSTGQRALRGFSEGTLALLRAGQGHEATFGLADRADEICPQHGQPVIEQYTATARGLLALGRRDGAAAVTHFQRAAGWARRSAQIEPCVLSWPADLVDAHLAAGDEASARVALAELRVRAEATRRPWALASVARLEAVLEIEGAWEAKFVRALELFEATQAPFDRARTLLAFGQALRRDGRRTDAREQLRTALEDFERLGAVPWAERAREELVATGERVRATVERDAGTLTPQELVVADMVAGGASNKEVAAAMFLSTKTVESHLRQIFRKVGVKSRTQLAAQVHREGLFVGPDERRLGAGAPAVQRAVDGARHGRRQAGHGFQCVARGIDDGVR